MEIVPTTYYENLKRYLRRRKYQRMYASNHSGDKRNLKITRLGVGGTVSPRRRWKIPRKPKLICLKRIFSPIKLVAKFHETYVDVMNRMAGSVAHKSSGAGPFAGTKVAKTEQISMVSCGDELVDSKLVLEIYKRLAASRQMNSIAR